MIRHQPAGRSRLAWFILFAATILTPPMLYGALRSVGTNSNRLDDWLPDHLVETQQLRRFNQWFGDGQFVIVSWEGCQIDLSRAAHDDAGDDPRIKRFTAELLANDSPGYFKSAITSRSLLEKLTAKPFEIGKRQAVARLGGSLIGPHGQACVVVVLNEVAIRQLRQAIGYRHPRWSDRNLPPGKLFAALQHAGVDLDDAHLGGPPIDNLSINEEGQRTLVRLGIAAGLLGLGLAYLSLRNVMLTAIVFACGVMATCGATAAIWLSGSHADAIVLAMPSLIYVLTISGAIHLVNYYRETVLHQGVAGAAHRAILMGFKPALLCNVTTAFGLLSLWSSGLTPIRHFGLFSACGMAWMLVILFLYLPAALEVFGTSNGFGYANQRVADDLLAGPAPRRFSGWGRRLAATMIAWRRTVTIAGLLALIGFGFGVTRIRTSVDLLKLYHDDTRILVDYRWLESHLGNLVPLEILLRFDHQLLGNSQVGDDSNEPSISIVQRAELVAGIARAIDQKFGIRGEDLISPPVSTVSFLPALESDQHSVGSIVRRTVMNRKFQSSRAALESSGYWAVDAETGDELWRISLRIAGFKEVDLGRLIGELKELVDPLVSESTAILGIHASEAPTMSGGIPGRHLPISVIHTGAIPVIHQAQRELLQSLIQSTIWSFLTITPLLMIVTRGIGSGLVAMLPNLLPVVAIFGAMGWLGLPVDIGCMMTASIALGVAVDDTIHYLFWFRHHQALGLSRTEAIEAACDDCFLPTVQAALVNGLGLSVFFFSTFIPTKQFGVLMLVILTFGAIAELILLPAILAGPLGRAFESARCPIGRTERVKMLVKATSGVG